MRASHTMKETLDGMLDIPQPHTSERIERHIEDVAVPQIMENHGVDSACAVPQIIEGILKLCVQNLKELVETVRFLKNVSKRTVERLRIAVPRSDVGSVEVGEIGSTA